MRAEVASKAEDVAGGGGALLSVQVMRGIAAVAVAVYHAHIMLSRPEAGGIDVFGPLAANGWLGVNFFFVLSGFIILYAHHRDVGQPSRLPRYAWRRFIRLYPVYWVILAAYVAGAIAGVGDAEIDWSADHLLSAISLTSLTHNPVLPLKLAWTLLFEVMFYAVFAVLIVSKRAGIALLAIWVAAIVLKNVIYPDFQFDLLHVWNLYFFAGMGVFLVHRRIAPELGWLVLVAGLAALIWFGVTLHGGITAADADPLMLAWLIIPFPLLLLGGVLLERRCGWKPPAFLLLLGDASYAIYLVHSAALSVFVLLNAKLMPRGVPDIVIFLAALSVAVTAGVVTHLVIERPLLKWLKSAVRLTPLYSANNRLSKSG